MLHCVTVPISQYIPFSKPQYPTQPRQGNHQKKKPPNNSEKNNQKIKINRSLTLPALLLFLPGPMFFFTVLRWLAEAREAGMKMAQLPGAAQT